MKELSRRDFLKLAGSAYMGLSLPSLKTEGGQEEISPLTELPALYTRNTPIKIEFLDEKGNPDPEKEPEWSIISDVPVDILPPITPVHFLELKVEPYANYPFAWVARLPHVTGSPTEVKAVVAWGDSHFYRSFNGRLGDKNTDLISTYLYTEKERTYATKIWNDFTAFAAIAKWQKEHGPIMPGEEFSYIETTDIVKRLYKDYKMGIEYWAGGICATVSTLAKAVFLAGDRGYTEILKRRVHRPIFQYWASPLDPGVTKENSDATVYFEDNPTLRWRNIDFAFRLLEDAPTPIYLSFAAYLNYDKKPSGRDRSYGSDARMTFSVSLKDKSPEIDEEEALLKLRQEYADFHQFAY